METNVWRYFKSFKSLPIFGEKSMARCQSFPAESSGCESPEAGHPHSPVSPLIGLLSGYD